MKYVSAKNVFDEAESAFSASRRPCTQGATQAVDGNSPAAPTARAPYLFVVDCETQRFTVEGPLAIECIDAWYREVDRASNAGRCLFCVPIAEMRFDEILEMGRALGYDHWPPFTIVAPPPKRQGETPDCPQLANRDRNYLRRVLSARAGNRTDWLSDIRKMAKRRSKAS